MSTATAQSPLNTESMRLEELRRAFDQTFALAPSPEGEPLASLIVIRVVAKPFVLRSEQITGLVKAKRIVPFPSSIPEVIGIAGIRGVLVPVFHLAPFLQLEFSRSTAHWLVLANPESPIGLAFDEFEGQVEVAPTDLYSEQTDDGSASSKLLVRIGPSVRPVIDIPQVVQEIRNRSGLPSLARSNHL